jgi:hypothetical protein
LEKGYKVDSVILDTGIVYAAADKKDSWHEKTVGFLANFRGRLIIPSTVIPEACYLLNTYLGQSAEIAFVNSINNKELAVEHFNFEDLERCIALLKKYGDLNLGFVDASVIAISERLKVYKIMSTDRRHFSAVRPKHCDALILLP